MVQLCRAQARSACLPGPSALDPFWLGNLVWVPCGKPDTGLGRRLRPLLQRPGCVPGWCLVALRWTPGSDDLFLNKRAVWKTFLLVLGWQCGLQWASCCCVPGAVASAGVRGHKIWVFSAFSSKVVPVPASPVSYRQAVMVQTPKCIGLCCLQATQAKVLYFRW